MISFPCGLTFQIGTRGKNSAWGRVPEYRLSNVRALGHAMFASTRCPTNVTTNQDVPVSVKYILFSTPNFYTSDAQRIGGFHDVSCYTCKMYRFPQSFY